MSSPAAIATAASTGAGSSSGALVASRPSARRKNAAPPPSSRIASQALDTPPSSSRRRDPPAPAPPDDASHAESADLSHGKDSSHSFLGDAVLETVPVPPPSSRKAVHKIESAPLTARPKVLKLSLQAKPSANGTRAPYPSEWLLLRRLFSRPYVVLVVLAGLATTFWGWNSPPPSPVKDASIVGEVAQLEEVLRKTSKMMQVQLELVDMKIVKEVEGLRKEMEEKIEEQRAAFGVDVQSLRAETEDIQASLSRLSETGFPTRQDVLELVNSVVDKRAAEGSGEALSLDDVRAVARRIVEHELEQHAADGIGKRDYALGTGGGKVVDHSEGFFLGRGADWGFSAFGFLSRTHRWASKLLEPSFGEPGQCLPLKGSSVHVDIALRTAIFPEAVTLEHVSKSVAYDFSSAPKDFRAFGWLESHKQGVKLDEPVKQVLLGEFTYDIEKKNVQTFPVLKGAVGNLINMLKLEVLSNHGSSSHTCIYRLRVHGSEPQATSWPTQNEM